MTDQKVLEIIYAALRAHTGNQYINDVTVDHDADGDAMQLILTTIDGDDLEQVWVIDSLSICETDSPG